MADIRIGIVELLTRIGDEKIQLQNLAGCGATEIRFGTEAITATELMNDAQKTTCLILWLPTEAVQAAKAGK